MSRRSREQRTWITFAVIMGLAVFEATARKSADPTVIAFCGTTLAIVLGVHGDINRRRKRDGSSGELDE